MNQIKLFNNPEFGQIRTLIIDDEPWFVGKDVAMILRYTNPQKAIRDHVDDEDRTMNEKFIVNGTMPVLINESGVYCLVLGSKLPTAKKFHRWITTVILPSIRKCGGYLSPDFLAEIFNNPESFDILLKQMANLFAENKNLKDEIMSLEPKVKYFDHMMNSDLLSTFTITAQQIGVRPRYFTKFLLNNKYLHYDNKRNLLPYQRYIDAGFFRVIEFSDERYFGRQTHITPKGRQHFLQCYFDGMMDQGKLF